MLGFSPLKLCSSTKTFRYSLILLPASSRWFQTETELHPDRTLPPEQPAERTAQLSSPSYLFEDPPSPWQPAHGSL